MATRSRAAITVDVHKLLVGELGGSDREFDDSTKLVEDLGADSLDTIEVVMAVEEEWGFDIQDEEAEKVVTIGDLISLVQAKLS